jgi:hypothetical protein
MAQAIKFHTIVKDRTLSLPDLGDFEGMRVEVLVVEEAAEMKSADVESKAPRPLGLLRGQILMADDFDAPLPPEIQKYFEGEGGDE